MILEFLELICRQEGMYDNTFYKTIFENILVKNSRPYFLDMDEIDCYQNKLN